MRFRVPTLGEFQTIYSNKDFRGTATTGLVQVFDNVSEEKKPTLVYAVFTEVYQRWQKWVAQTPGPDRARAIHKQIDIHIANMREDRGGLGESCRAGCSNCCYLEVSVTRDEAQLLAHRVRSGIAIDMERLRKQAALRHNDDGNHDEWSSQPREIRKCVFLGDDEVCRVYSDRPGACRKYFVSTPPEDCFDPKGTHQGIGILQAEIEMSAAYNLADSFGAMSQQLLNALQLEEVRS